MEIALVLLAFCQLVALVGIAWYFNRILERKQRILEDLVRSWIQTWLTPPGEGKPHKLAELIAAAGEVIGSSAARSIMASLNADKSHVARAANGIVDEAQAQANPILALLAGSKRGKGAALARLAELIGPALMGASGGLGGAGDNGRKTAVQERLWKGG